MNKNSLIKNRLLVSSLLIENQFLLAEEKFEKKIGHWFTNAYNLKFLKSETKLYFEVAFYEIAEKEEINSFSFQLKDNSYTGKGYNVLRVDDFCTINKHNFNWSRIGVYPGNNFEEKLNNLITDFEHFVRNTDLIKVFRGEVWYDQYWINPRD